MMEPLTRERLQECGCKQITGVIDRSECRIADLEAACSKKQETIESHARTILRLGEAIAELEATVERLQQDSIAMHAHHDSYVVWHGEQMQKKDTEVERLTRELAEMIKLHDLRNRQVDIEAQENARLHEALQEALPYLQSYNATFSICEKVEAALRGEKP